jgi:type I restriction enzyme S subunit
VPQDPTDEPASVLLARIREEKARLVKEKKIKKDKNESLIYRGDDNSYYEKFADGTVKCIDEEIPFEIPQGWEWARMGSIGNWGAGATPSRGNSAYYKDGEILWLKTGELNDGVIYDSEEKITQLALRECSLKLNKVGDVLIAMYGATIGKLGIVGQELTTNQACCGCTPYEGIYNYYLFYFLMANKTNFIKQGEGGAQPNISRDKLVKFLIPLPPLQEQKRIVMALDNVLASIMRN